MVYVKYSSSANLIIHKLNTFNIYDSWCFYIIVSTLREDAQLWLKNVESSTAIQSFTSPSFRRITFVCLIELSMRECLTVERLKHIIRHNAKLFYSIKNVEMVDRRALNYKKDYEFLS